MRIINVQYHPKDSIRQRRFAWKSQQVSRIVSARRLTYRLSNLQKKNGDTLRIQAETRLRPVLVYLSGDHLDGISSFSKPVSTCGISTNWITERVCR